MNQDEGIGRAAAIVAAYVSHNSLPAAELPGLIALVHAALAALDRPPAAEMPAAAKSTSTQIRRSITPDALVSFEDGKPYRTLRRHLTARGLTPEAYRAKWGLPGDYPMVAAGYSQERSALAHARGLGRKRAVPAPEPVAPTEVATAPKQRGRRERTEA